MHAAGFCLNSAGKPIKDDQGQYVRVDPQSLADAKLDRWAAQPNFPEVPADLLEPRLWNKVLSKQWKHADAIHNLEARATVKVGERIANVRSLGSKRILILNDNLAVVLAFSRRRAKHFPLLIQIRRMAAIALAKNLRFSYRWIPSELNVADFDSRHFEDSAPKPSSFSNYRPPFGSNLQDTRGAPTRPADDLLRESLSPFGSLADPTRSHFGSSHLPKLGHERTVQSNSIENFPVDAPSTTGVASAASDCAGGDPSRTSTVKDHGERESVSGDANKKIFASQAASQSKARSGKLPRDGGGPNDDGLCFRRSRRRGRLGGVQRLRRGRHAGPSAQEYRWSGPNAARVGEASPSQSAQLHVRVATSRSQSLGRMPHRTWSFARSRAPVYINI